MSVKTLSSACPICKLPVTFGGGITIVKDFLLLSILEENVLFSIQYFTHFSSTFFANPIKSYLQRPQVGQLTKFIPFFLKFNDFVIIVLNVI